MTDPTDIDATASSTTEHIGVEDADEWVDEGEGYDDDDDDYEDGEEEAEEIARRLKEQLWADISKAQADRVGATSSTPSAPLQENVPSGVPSQVPISQQPPTPSTSSKKEGAALQTMKNVLEIARKDPLVRSTLASAVVPGAGNNSSVLEILGRAVAAGTIAKELAKSLSLILVSLARSDALFAAMRHSNAPAVQLDKGKRKRDETEEERQKNESRAFKRSAFAHSDLQSQIADAVRVVSETLVSHPPSNGPPDPSIISSIQLQLHQIFLFAVTSSAKGGPETNTLQEISGLIQVVGILSGSPIGPTAVPPNAPMPDIPQPGVSMYTPRPWIPPGTGPQPVPFSDIGTAVYPCLVPTCRKIFARLFNLRAHQQMHALHRPYRCAACPASFARNHDLKRHTKLHDKMGYQCTGCYKLFSRRDAIKRHKNSSAARGGKGEACINAAIKEVELDKEGGEEAREGRRTRMWADLVTNSLASAVNFGTYGDDWGPEDGEMDSDVIRHAQGAVLSLHKTLQEHVSSALGTTADHDVSPMDVDPTGGQATLASVIARAQLQNMSSSQTPQQDMSAATTAPSATEPFFAVEDGSYISHDDYPAPSTESATVSAPPLSLYGLSEEQARLLEQAIANAASAAQAQAEAEAALEEQEEDYEEEYDEPDDGDAGISSTATEVPQASGS